MAFVRHDTPFDCVPFTNERAPWLGGDLQTLRNTFIRISPPLAQGEAIRISVRDDDQLVCYYHKTHQTKKKGLIIIAHGLAGDADSSYVRYLALGAMARGYDALRLNLRGAGAGHLLAKSSYHAGRADDLQAVCFAMADRFPDTPLYLSAYSLGGTMAVNMASRLALPSALAGVISFCAPLDMMASAKRFHAPRNKLYNRHFTKSLIKLTMARYHRDPTILPDDLTPERICRVKTVREFDDIFTSKIAGYADANAYYHGTTPLPYLADITVPTLLVHSDNDPLIPSKAYEKIKTHRHVFCVITRGGGHVGFHSRYQPFDCWQTQMALRFFDQLIS